MEPPVRYARSGGLNIAYQVVGDGPIDLVMAPGWATHLDLGWEIPPLARFYRRLTEFSRLILFDKRGVGLSDGVNPDSLPTLEQRMEDLTAVMDAAESDRAAIFGTIGGAAMAGLFAATFPSRTEALILYGAGAKLDFKYPIADYGSVEAFVDHLERDWAEGPTLPRIAPSLEDDPALRRAYVRLERSSMSPAAARAMMYMGREVDFTSALEAINVPTLVLHRTGDAWIPIAQGRALGSAIRGARFVELPGEDHLFWVGDSDVIFGHVQEFLTGSRPEPDVDRVLATVMFTDIVSSTETAVRLGDKRWRSLLDEHDGVVRRCLDTFRGKEVNRTGDGFLVTFDGPARAIRCAKSIVDSVRPLGLEIRAGLHTGEVELTGGGIGGVAVHIAARVSALAGPSQVLVSSTVKDLVAGAGLHFLDRGARTLKGVPGEWRLFLVAS